MDCPVVTIPKEWEKNGSETCESGMAKVLLKNGNKPRFGIWQPQIL